jgi:hypothetical protein
MNCRELNCVWHRERGDDWAAAAVAVPRSSEEKQVLYGLSCSVSQAISCYTWNRKVHHRVHKSQPLYVTSMHVKGEAIPVTGREGP